MDVENNNYFNQGALDTQPVSSPGEIIENTIFNRVYTPSVEYDPQSEPLWLQTYSIYNDLLQIQVSIRDLFTWTDEIPLVGTDEEVDQAVIRQLERREMALLNRRRNALPSDF